MTREEYIILVREYYPDIIQTMVSFPTLLNLVALRLFLKQDISSSLAVETLRRLKELSETGITL